MDFSFLPSLGETVAVGMAFLLTTLIGFERELRHKDAGIRTHVLVGIGSCLFTLISINGAPDFLTGDIRWDASRIAAQIVSGIGFIGAGVIWFHHDAIRGLTTASAIWVAAAIGTACGAQMFGLAILVVLAYFLLVLVISPLYYRVRRRSGQVLEITYAESRGILRNILIEVAQRGFESQVLSSRQNRYQDHKDATVTIRLSGSKDLDALIEWLTDYDGVSEVSTAEESD